MGRKRDPPLPSPHAEAGCEIPRQGAEQLGVVGCSRCTVNQSGVPACSCRKQPALHGTSTAQHVAWHRCTGWIDTGSSGLGGVMSEELSPEEGRHDELHQGDELWPPPVTATTLGWRGAASPHVAAQLAEPAPGPPAWLITAFGFISHPTC